MMDEMSPEGFSQDSQPTLGETLLGGLKGLGLIILILFIMISPWPYWTSIPKHYFPPRPKRRGRTLLGRMFP